jgi:hypothetical protein
MHRKRRHQSKRKKMEEERTNRKDSKVTITTWERNEMRHKGDNRVKEWIHEE